MSNDADLTEIIRLAQQVQKALAAAPKPTDPPAAPPPAGPPPAADPGMPTVDIEPAFGPGAGPYKVGEPITRKIGTYPNATAVAGRRYRGKDLIAGGTSATYTITPEDVGPDLFYEELVVRNDTKKQAWIKSAPVKAVAGTPAPSPAPTDALKSAVDDMKLRNDFVLKGYEHKDNGWYIASDNGMGAHPVIDEVSTATWSEFYRNLQYWGKTCTAALPWCVIFDGVDDHSENTGVELFDLMGYIKSKATRKWNLFSSAAVLSGVNYSKPLAGLDPEDETRFDLQGNRVPDDDDEHGRIIMLPRDRGRFWHGWGSRRPIDPNDVAAVFVKVKARLITLPGKPDDRDKAQIGLQVGNDYYVSMDQNFPGVGYAPSACIARTRRLTKEAQTYTCCTLTDVGSQNPGKTGITVAEFMAEPPPL